MFSQSCEPVKTVKSKEDPSLQIGRCTVYVCVILLIEKGQLIRMSLDTTRML